jgi:hypothetical protein
MLQFARQYALAAAVALFCGDTAIACPSKATRDKGFKITFDNGDVASILDYQDETLHYRTDYKNGKVGEVSSKYGLFILDSKLDRQEIEFSYITNLDAYKDLKPGTSFVVEGELSNGNRPIKFTQSFSIGDRERVTVGNCEYDAVSLTREWVYFYPAQTVKSRIKLLLEPDLLVALRTTIENLAEDGTKISEKSYLAREITD